MRLPTLLRWQAQKSDAEWAGESTWHSAVEPGHVGDPRPFTGKYTQVERMPT